MKVISVKFKESGRVYYFDPGTMEIHRGDYVIVETARGTECGEVVRGVHEVSSNGFNKELKPVIRMADGVDVRRMHQNRAGLDEDSGIQIQITYIEECGTEFAASDEDVVSEPAVELHIVIRKKSVNVSAAHVLLVQVKHCDLRIILEDHTGNNLVADLHRLAGCVDLNVLTHCNDLAGSFMSQNYRNQAEGIVFVFVSIGSADAAAFNLNQDIVVSNFRKGILLQFEVLLLCHHRNSCGLRDHTGSCRRSGSSCRSGRRCAGSCHSGENLFHDFFDINVVHIHCLCPPDQRMQRLSDITQRLLLVKVLALVSPSPVRLAIVKVQ